MKPNEFYLRYYVGHDGKHGHEFLEFELTSNGRLRYTNNTSYKGENSISREWYVSTSVIGEFSRIVKESNIFSTHPNRWPLKDRAGR